MTLGKELVETRWTIIAPSHKPGAWRILCEAYGGQSRAYHSWAHIADLLRKLDDFACLAARADLVSAAIFWHDAVYATQKSDGSVRSDQENVRDSAALFESFALFGDGDRSAILDLITATANHLHAKATREHYPGFAGDLDLFLDLDLSPLAAPWDLFAENFKKIRFEYSWQPETEFLTAQLQSLKGFASAGDRLFRCPQTRELWLSQAKANLARSMEELQTAMTRSQSFAGLTGRSPPRRPLQS